MRSRKMINKYVSWFGTASRPLLSKATRRTTARTIQLSQTDVDYDFFPRNGSSCLINYTGKRATSGRFRITISIIVVDADGNETVMDSYTSPEYRPTPFHPATPSISCTLVANFSAIETPVKCVVRVTRYATTFRITFQKGHMRTNFLNDEHTSYVGGQEGVANSLQQKLSVLRNELWWQVNYGLPLFEKVKSKTVIDAYIIQTVLDHNDVISFINFNSVVEDRQYHCTFDVLTKYGEMTLEI